MPPLLLCIETATPLCSVAVGRGTQVLALREVDSAKLAHAEKVNVFIAEVMEEAGSSLNDLDAIAVGTGPGSYTGLRIGLSAAKGLCYALDKPLIGLSTLGTLVNALRLSHPLLPGTWWPLIDARRMEVFAQPFDASGSPTAASAPLILDEAWCTTANGYVVFGDGADKAADLFAAFPQVKHIPAIKPSAAAMLAAASERFTAGRFDDLAYLVPDYGKGANVGKAKG